MEWLYIVVGALIGIPLNVFSAHLYAQYEVKRRRVFDVEGVWGEFVPAEGENQLSLGEIYYDRRRKMFAFDGTNYFNNGEIYCHWVTISSSLSEDDRTFNYIFKKTMPSEPGAVYYGFGVVQLALNGHHLVPVEGHYISASLDGRAMAHTMVRLEALSYARGRLEAKIVAELAKQLHATIAPSPENMQSPVTTPQ